MAKRTTWRAEMLWLACSAGLAFGPAVASAMERGERSDDKVCTETATAAYSACGYGVLEEYQRARGICLNLLEDEAEEECVDEARTARRDGHALCRSQRTGRREACKVVGEAPFAPDFSPSLFDADFNRLTRGNRYLPLRPGNRWEYRSDTESVSVEVLEDTKRIEGVTCIVVRDRVRDGGQLVEDTDDWFAQARNGDVYYCGEEVKDFEFFEGDDPQRPELISIDGSFKTGRDGDQPGIAFRGIPRRGETYRQEFSLGNAEDMAEVLSTNYAFGRDPVLDELVPRGVVDRYCAGDCVVTREYSPLSPGEFERKYYAPGVGKILGTNPTRGTVSSLVACNLDRRCPALPTP